MASRMPGCFAAIYKVLEEVSMRLPAFRPTSILDFGAGPGTAIWAAQEVVPAALQRPIMQCCVVLRGLGDIVLCMAIMFGPWQKQHYGLMARCWSLSQVWGQVPDVLAVEPSRDMAALGQQIEASQDDTHEGQVEGSAASDTRHAPVRWVSSLPGAGLGSSRSGHQQQQNARRAPLLLTGAFHFVFHGSSRKEPCGFDKIHHFRLFTAWSTLSLCVRVVNTLWSWMRNNGSKPGPLVQ